MRHPLVILVACILSTPAARSRLRDAPLADRERVPCSLEIVTHDWDFTLGTQGFYVVDCDNGGASIWEHGSTIFVPDAPGPVWGTLLHGNYPNESGQGLISPLFLVDEDSYRLEIYHYFDTETWFDGCNVTVGRWPNGTVIEPLDGYSVEQISAPPNYYAWCVDNEAGWTGQSDGWRVDCFDLSDYIGTFVEIELDFGSDVSGVRPGWYIARVRVGAGPPEGAVCCIPSNGACQILVEEDCIALGGDWHPDWYSCDPNPCPPAIYWPLEVQAGPWLNPEPWHAWVPFSEPHLLKLTLPIPAMHDADITLVEFYYYDPVADGWVYLGEDNDGGEARLDTEGGSLPAGDGWSLATVQAIPVTDPLVQFKAIAYYGGGGHSEFYGERFLDVAPPSLAQLNIQDWMVIEDDTLDLLVEPNGAAIDSVIVFVAAKEDTFVKGVAPISQQSHTAFHCAPTAAAACLKYFEQWTGDQTVTAGLPDEELVDSLAAFMATNRGGSGTRASNWLAGLNGWISDHGGGYTVQGHYHYAENGGRIWSSADWRRVRNELERCQDVLLGVFWDGGGAHALTLNAITNTPLPNGRLAVNLADPWTGAIETGEVDPLSGRIENLSGAAGGEGCEIGISLIVSPREEVIATGPGPVVYRGPIPTPPASVRVPLRYPGYWWVHVIVVNAAGNAQRFVHVVRSAPYLYVPQEGDDLPWVLHLDQPEPNPTLGITQISFAVPAREHVRLALYDAAGRRVRTLLDRAVGTGLHRVALDGRDEEGRLLPAGVYYIRLVSARWERTRRLTVLR